MSENTKVSGFLAMCLLVTLIVAPLSIYTIWNRDDVRTKFLTAQNQSAIKGRLFFSFKIAGIYDKNPGGQHAVFKRSTKKRLNSTQIHENQCKKAKSCSDCTSLSKYNCLWCEKGKRCSAYSIEKFFPEASHCEWIDSRWGTCWIDLRAIIITLSCIGGILLLLACCCVVKFCKCVCDCVHVVQDCCCCSCFAESRARRKENMQLRRLERKLETQARRQEMMLKYGQKVPGMPFRSTANNYTFFENEPV